MNHQSSCSRNNSGTGSISSRQVSEASSNTDSDTVSEMEMTVNSAAVRVHSLVFMDNFYKYFYIHCIFSYNIYNYICIYLFI